MTIICDQSDEAKRQRAESAAAIEALRTKPWWVQMAWIVSKAIVAHGERK